MSELKSDLENNVKNDLEPENHTNNQKVLAAFAVIMVVVILAVGITYFTNKKDSGVSDTAVSTTSDSPPSSPDTSSSEASSSYKDGTYSSSGSYQTPGGKESIGVTVTLKDGVVTDTSLQQSANNRDTKEYQGQFASGYKTQVVGKALSSISLSRVSGSSLTSDGFNKALDQIKTQAQV